MGTSVILGILVICVIIVVKKMISDRIKGNCSCGGDCSGCNGCDH